MPSETSRLRSMRFAMSMLISISITRGMNTMLSVIRLGSGSMIAIMIISPPYKYFRFFVTDEVFKIPAFTSNTMYMGKVNINPNNKRLKPTVEKKT